jgi:hypothetical protein
LFFAGLERRADPYPKAGAVTFGSADEQRGRADGTVAARQAFTVSAASRATEVEARNS